MPQTKHAWGDWTGAIYRDFRLRYPLTILSGPQDNQTEALPIVEFRVKAKGFKGCVVTGECESGQFVCDLLPIDKAILGSRSLVGELKSSGTAVGLATVGPTEDMAQLGIINSFTSNWNMSVRRKDKGLREGDVVFHVFQNSVCAAIAEIKRRDVSWSEEIKSGLGFRRSKRGFFLPAARKALASVEQKSAFLFLLTCYLQLLELQFNTDISSS